MHIDYTVHQQLEWGAYGLVKGHYPSASEAPFLCFSSCCEWASQVVQLVKNPPANVGDTRNIGLILGREDPLEREMATQSRVLAWEIS